MKTIYGTILNEIAMEVPNVKIELYSKDVLISDIMIGEHPEPLMTTTSSSVGAYSMVVLDDFEGYVVVPVQKIGSESTQVDFNYAIVNVITSGLNYNVVVKTTQYDIHDLNMDGSVDLLETQKWLQEELKRVTTLEYKVSQFESKFRMLVELIIPMILKK